MFNSSFFIGPKRCAAGALLAILATACADERPPAASLEGAVSSAGPRDAGNTIQAPPTSEGGAGALDAGAVEAGMAEQGEILADGQQKPTAVTRGGKNLYWLAEGAGDGKLMRMPIGGGVPSVVASGLVQPDSLRIDGERAYWLAYGDQAGIHSVALGGGAVQKLVNASAPVPLRQLALGATHVYFTDGPGGAVRRVAKSGGTAETIASGLSGPGEIVVAGSDVYIIESSESGRVLHVPGEGGAATPLAEGQPMPMSLVVTAEDVYWIDTGRFDPATQSFSGAGIMRVPRRGGTPVSVASILDASSLATDGSAGVFFVVGDAIMHAPRGAAPASYALLQRSPRGLAIDETYAYWANAGTSAKLYADGQIRRRALR